MDISATVLRLPDGRDLSFAEYGDPDGIPVFGFHGTPGSRRQLAPVEGMPVPGGIRLLAPDRPGYGFSSFQPKRRLTDWPADVQAIAEHLGLEDFEIFASDWGFRLEDTRIPVHFWQGDLDRNVPPHHVRILADAVPQATIHDCPGEGHMLVLERLDEILAVASGKES
jgi:pimeloyl-ACP methyl ester carboxylesterase